MKKLFRK